MPLEIEIVSVKASSVLLFHPAFSLECRCDGWNSSSNVGSGCDLENCAHVLRLAEQQDKRPWASDDTIGASILSLGCLLPDSQ